MSNRISDSARSFHISLLVAMLILSTGCHPTRHLGKDQYLLRRNDIGLSSDHKITGKGEIKDNLSKLIFQKPNSRFLGVPVKLLLYNRHYAKLHLRQPDSLPKSVERPVISDTALIRRSAMNMKNYLFTIGYFYAKVDEKVKIRHKNAYVKYTINTGVNYVINKVNYYSEDSAIAKLIRESANESVLTKGTEFKFSLLEDERSRITAVLRNNGYYRFTQENINFLNGMDTVDKSAFKNVESPFEGAVSFALQNKTQKKRTIDLDVHIQMADDTAAFSVYKTGQVNVYTEYNSPADINDTTLIKDKVNDINFLYHSLYVHPKVLYEHMYLAPDNLYSQSDFDKTFAKLTELGIFQYVRVLPVEPRKQANGHILNYNVFLKKTKKHDFSTNYEISSGSTYFLGNSLSLNYRDRNLLKGANLLTLGVNGGIETSYNENLGKMLINHFSLLTTYYGASFSVDFPKFLAPIAYSRFDNSNLPHTIIGGGENVIDRVSYFTLLNTSANFTYSWHQTATRTWTLSPAFVNIIHLPKETDSFRRVLDSNAFLRNSYKENFIEGENISFTYDDNIKKHGLNYSYVRLGLEEAGGFLGGINQLGAALNDLYKIQYAQYTKFDFDLHHYFTFGHKVIAMRFIGGVGIPYGQSDALPYIKQYFAGGPYSLRGWRIRTLGPGNYYDFASASSSQIDRTGDIKLEYNSEFRFPITPLFAGAVKMNGALFFDAGNIWLAHPDPGFPGGNFTLPTLGQDIASDIGAGTRFDIASFLTLRVDVAVPVKKPYIHDYSGWVFDQIDITDPTWRSNNIVFNISIGYPF